VCVTSRTSTSCSHYQQLAAAYQLLGCHHLLLLFETMVSKHCANVSDSLLKWIPSTLLVSIVIATKHNSDILSTTEVYITSPWKTKASKAYSVTIWQAWIFREKTEDHGLNLATLSLTIEAWYHQQQPVTLQAHSQDFQEGGLWDPVWGLVQEGKVREYTFFFFFFKA